MPRWSGRGRWVQVGYVDAAGRCDGGRPDAELAVAFEEIGARLPDKSTYVAIVERPPDVEVGMDGLIERQSLHVIRGTW